MVPKEMMEQYINKAKIGGKVYFHLTFYYQMPKSLSTYLREIDSFYPALKGSKTPTSRF